MAGSVVLLVAGWRNLGIKLIDRCAQLTRQFRSLGCSLEVHSRIRGLALGVGATGLSSTQSPPAQSQYAIKSYLSDSHRQTVMIRFGSGSNLGQSAD